MTKLYLFAFTAASFAAEIPLAAPDPNYLLLRDAQPDNSIAVENVEIRRDAGHFIFQSGTISFGKAVLGRVTLAVFIGQGEFRLSSKLPLENAYIGRVLGKEEVRQQFESAVLVFTDETAAELRRDAKPLPLDARAAARLRTVRNRLRYNPPIPRSTLEALFTSESIENVEANVLMDLYNPARRGFFTAYIAGKDLKDLRFLLRPRGALPMLPSPEEVALIHYDPLGMKEAILYLAHEQREYEEGKASSHEEKRSATVERYRIETTLGNDDRLTSAAEILLRGVTGGDRVIRFDLLPSLRVTSAAADGASVPFIQEDRRQDGSLYIVLPKALGKDEKAVLKLDYRGDKVVQKAGGGNLYVGARTSWYPSLNAFNDRSHFDLTFRYPKAYTLVSIGKVRQQSQEGASKVSQWVTDVPVPVAGFNFGDFKRKDVKDEPTHYEIEGYASSSVPDYLKGAQFEATMNPARLLDQAMGQAQNSIRIFSNWFGLAPYGRLAITQQPEFNFGQSWPSLLYLPMAAFLDSTQRWSLLGSARSMADFVDEVTAHEVSHQWWGHLVGWASFHDQWLSEGFAEFSAGVYLQNTAKSATYLDFWKRARRQLVEKDATGQRPSEAGPLSLGLRLNTPKHDQAYNAVVYRKGGYVLHMLRCMMQDGKGNDAAFISMMRDFVKIHAHRNASTETFQAVVEKHMLPTMDLERNRSMDWFFRQWVYGTEIPRYKSEFKVEPAGDKWQLTGSVTQSDVGKSFQMLVPIYLDFDGRIVRLGQLTLRGPSTYGGIKILLPQKPKRVLLNANYDVLEL